MARYDLAEILSYVYDPRTASLRTTEFGSSYQKRLDYDGRSDDNPVYVGYAAKGEADSAANWLVNKLTYDGSDRVTLVQSAKGAWTDRAALTYE